MNTGRWTIGARAITVGGRWPTINAGALVVITWYDPNQFDSGGNWVPFWVERIDGKQFLWTHRGRWRLTSAVWISQQNLRIIEEDWEGIMEATDQPIDDAEPEGPTRDELLVLAVELGYRTPLDEQAEFDLKNEWYRRKYGYVFKCR